MPYSCCPASLPETSDCTSRACCVPDRRHTLRARCFSAPAAPSCRASRRAAVPVPHGCGGRSSRRGWMSAPSGSSARRARRPLRRPACYRYAEGHQGGASRRRWPGVSAGLCLGRPARRTPGPCARTSRRPMLYATVFLGSPVSSSRTLHQERSSRSGHMDSATYLLGALMRQLVPPGSEPTSR